MSPRFLPATFQVLFLLAQKEKLGITVNYAFSVLIYCGLNWSQLGRFLRGVLADLGAWAKDEKIYKAEIVDKLLPSFMRVWQRTNSSLRPIKPADMTQWETFRKLVAKW